MSPCTICSHPDAGRIAELLRSGRSARSVAAEFRISYDALTRHARNHLGRSHSVATDGMADREPLGDPLDELVAALRSRALAGNPADTREYRLALLAQGAARHAARPVAALETTPEWLRLRTAILAALEPFQEARQAVADALETV